MEYSYGDTKVLRPGGGVPIPAVPAGDESRVLAMAAFLLAVRMIISSKQNAGPPAPSLSSQGAGKHGEGPCE